MEFTAKEQRALRVMVSNHININCPQGDDLKLWHVIYGKLLAPLSYERKVSNCCGAYPRGNGDCDTEDLGICSDCKEHCEYVLEENR
jgi:hypothetical protein